MRRINQNTTNIKSFLFKLFNKEFLIFLFFLALSSTFWLLMTLNETYEKELKIPIHLTNIPKNVVITTMSKDTVTVTVKDKGFTLLAYMSNKQIPINFNFETFSSKTNSKGIIALTDIAKQTYLQLYGSTRISSVKPDHIDFYFNYGEYKRVPVKLVGKIEPEKSYYLAGKKIYPEAVTVYAHKSILDTIKYITTNEMDVTNFNDTVVKTVELKMAKGIKAVPSTVKVTLYPDILTEQTLEVPITAINMPEGKVLRTFPSKVTVRFSIGASMFRNVKPEQFKVVADYNELKNHPSDKCTLHLRVYPHTVSRCHLDIQKIDYLIEQL